MDQMQDRQAWITSTKNSQNDGTGKWRYREEELFGLCRTTGQA